MKGGSTERREDGTWYAPSTDMYSSAEAELLNYLKLDSSFTSSISFWKNIKSYKAIFERLGDEALIHVNSLLKYILNGRLEKVYEKTYPNLRRQNSLEITETKSDLRSKINTTFSDISHLTDFMGNELFSPNMEVVNTGVDSTDKLDLSQALSQFISGSANMSNIFSREIANADTYENHLQKSKQNTRTNTTRL